MAQEKPSKSQSDVTDNEETVVGGNRRSPKPRTDKPDPTRFGDWEKGGRCIDF